MDAEAATYWLGWVKLGQLVAFFLVAIGVAAEFAGEWASRPLEKIVDGAREKEIAELKRETAEANQKAEEERLERLKLEEKLAPRSLTREQQDELRAALEKFAGTKVDLVAFVQGTTSDTLPLGILLRDIFLTAKLDARLWTTLSSVAHLTGVLVAVREGSGEAVESAANTIVAALLSQRIGASRWDAFNFKTGDLKEIPAGGLSGPPWEADKVAPIRMLIGSKPI